MVNLLLPDIAGSAMQGYQQGRQTAANRLIGLAMSNPDQASQYYGQAAQINPGQVMQVQDAQARNQYMQQLGQAQQARTQQAQQDLAAKKAGAAARYWKNAVSTGDPAAKAAATQAVLPFLSQMAAQQGKPAPTAADLDSPQAMAGLDHIIAATAYLFPQEKPISLGPDTTLLDPATYKVIYQGQGDAGSVVTGMTYHGMPVFRDKMGNLKDVYGRPIPQQGSSNGAPGNAPAQGAPQGAGAQAAGAPNVGQPAPASVIDGNVPAGAQVTQAMGADGTRVAFAFAPDTPDAVKAQAGAAAGIPQSSTSADQGPPGLHYTPRAESALDQKIAMARQMGATPDQIKGMVLGQTADPGQSGMNLLTEDGKALMDAAIAHGYNMPMPSMGYGKAGTAAKADAINSLAERFKGAGISPDAAVSQMMQGNTAISGLRALQNVNSKILGFEQSAEKEADLALTASAKVGRSGSPLFNEWVLAGRQSLAGDTNVTRFNNSVNALAEDYARVIGGGNPAATDSARSLAHKMINGSMNSQQFQGVVDQMRQEMHARTTGMGSALQTMRSAATANDGTYTSGWPGQPQEASRSDPQSSAPSGIDAIVAKYRAH